MKKIKINEIQAKMLKDIKDSKVLKVTQEQYNTILEMEGVVIEELQSDEVLGVAEKGGKFFIAAFSDRVTPGVNNTIESLYQNPKYIFHSKEEAEKTICKEMDYLGSEMAESVPLFEDNHGYNFVSNISTIDCGVLGEDIHSQINRGFQQNLGPAKSEFNKTKIPGIREMYEAFVHELYNVNEGGERKYEGLINLMEVGRFIQNRKINKESFNGDKKMVENAISAAVYEMAKSGSKYKAMESLEEALRKGPTGIDPTRGTEPGFESPNTGKSPEELRTALAKIKSKEKERRSAAGEESYDPIEDPEVRDDAVDALADGMKEDQHNMKKETAAKMKETENANQTWKGEAILNHPLLAEVPEDPSQSNWNDSVSLPTIDGHSSSKAANKGIIQLFIRDFTRYHKVEPILDGNLKVVNKGYDEKIEKIRQGIGASQEGSDLDETDANSSGQSTGASALVDNKKKAVHKSNAISALDTKDEYTEVEAGEVDEMTSSDSSGAVFKTNAIANKDGKIDGFDTVDMHPQGSKGPHMVRGKVVTEDEGETRYGVDMDFYVWARSDEEAKTAVKRIAIEMDRKYDNQPKIRKLYKQPHGTQGSSDIALTEDAFSKSQYPGGTIVTPKEKCKKFPYCDEGPGNFDEKKTKDSVISNDTNLYEAIAKKTGRSIDEVKKIIENSIK